MKKETLWNALEWALRINVFVKLFIYGTGKIIGGQFYTPDQIPEEVAQTPLGVASGYDLAWTFFGHSYGYILFIGISQLVAASLFLWPRTKLIGGLLLLPILMNIIVVDSFFGVAYGALFSACFYLTSVVFVLLRGRDQMRNAIRQLWVGRWKNTANYNTWVYLGGIALLFAIVFAIEIAGIQWFGFEDR